MHPFERMMMYGLTLSLWSIVLIPIAVLTLAVPYAVLRMREARSQTPDPQLGFKVVMHYFFSLAVLLVLFGVTMVVADLLWSVGDQMGRGDFPSDVQRFAFGLILSGILFAVVHFLCLVSMVGAPFSSPVRRTFLGCRLAIHGLVMMSAVTALLVALFQQPDRFGNNEITNASRRAILGILLVWTPSWIVHLVLFRVGPAAPAERERPWPEGERERTWDR